LRRRPPLPSVMWCCTAVTVTWLLRRSVAASTYSTTTNRCGRSTKTDPVLFLLISDDANEPVRRLVVPAKKGLQRATWDLRLAAPDPVKLDKPEFTEPWETPPRGPLVAPGTYNAQLVVAEPGGHRAVGAQQSFAVTPIPALANQPDLDATIQFWHDTWELQRDVLAAAKQLGKAQTRIKEDRADLSSRRPARGSDAVDQGARRSYRLLGNHPAADHDSTRITCHRSDRIRAAGDPGPDLTPIGPGVVSVASGQVVALLGWFNDVEIAFPTFVL